MARPSWFPLLLLIAIIVSTSFRGLPDFHRCQVSNGGPSGLLELPVLTAEEIEPALWILPKDLLFIDIPRRKDWP